MNRTGQQSTFIDVVIAAVKAGGGRNFCLRARAGTGKSASCLELVDDYLVAFPGHEVTLCAFGNAASKELAGKLVKRGHTDWKKVQAATIHSLGFGLVKFAFRLTKDAVDDKKVQKIVDTCNGEVYQEYGQQIVQLVKFAKLEGFGFFEDCQIGDASAWYRIAEHYDVNGFEDDTSALDDVVAAAQHVYKLSLADTRTVDFDDMVLFPLVKNLKVKFQRDLVVVDEAQDTGRARQALVRKFVKRNGTLIVVGDDRQAIFGFAGAQSNALDQLIQGLNAQVLPLTVCWRCPRAVIREAQKLVPDIEWAPEAIEGSVSALPALPSKAELNRTDAILCRNTAPLVEQAYGLIRQGVACRVEGRDIGQGLAKLIKRWKVTTIDAFLKKLDDWKERETQKALAKGRDSKVAEVADKAETLKHIADACIAQGKTQVQDMVDFIDALFVDSSSGSQADQIDWTPEQRAEWREEQEKRQVLTLATYHRAKGREWPRVFLLQHKSRCPSPWARQAWQQEQEANLAYVAITRAQEHLVYLQ